MMDNFISLVLVDLCIDSKTSALIPSSGCGPHMYRGPSLTCSEIALFRHNSYMSSFPGDVGCPLIKWNVFAYKQCGMASSFWPWVVLGEAFEVAVLVGFFFLFFFFASQWWHSFVMALAEASKPPVDSISHIPDTCAWMSSWVGPCRSHSD